jgi:hypothetical protein
MRMKSMRSLILCVGVLALVAPAVAQEGHPLKGTWYGDFGTRTDRHDLTVVLDWEALEITGVIDPGPDAIPIKSAELDISPGIPAAEGQGRTEGTPPEFRVRIEVDAPNDTGGTDTFIFEGMIVNPVAGNRRIVGTWTCGDTNGNFQIRRL